jgi:hypothetical protein
LEGVGRELRWSDRLHSTLRTGDESELTRAVNASGSPKVSELEAGVRQLEMRRKKGASQRAFMRTFVVRDRHIMRIGPLPASLARTR